MNGSGDASAHSRWSDLKTRRLAEMSEEDRERYEAAYAEAHRDRELGQLIYDLRTEAGLTSDRPGRAHGHDAVRDLPARGRRRRRAQNRHPCPPGRGAGPLGCGSVSPTEKTIRQSCYTNQPSNPGEIDERLPQVRLRSLQAPVDGRSRPEAFIPSDPPLALTHNPPSKSAIPYVRVALSRDLRTCWWAQRSG